MFPLFNKINVSRIIRDHIGTLIDAQTRKISVWDLILFFVLPAIAAVLILFVMGTPIDRPISNILITSLSVFSGLLLNLLLLIYDLVMKEVQESGQEQEPTPKGQLLREIVANISYSILVSVFCVAILLIAYLDIGSGVFLKIFSFSVYFLVIQFLLTLFMVLKRVHVLFSFMIMTPVLNRRYPTPPSLRKGTRRPRKSLS